MLHNGNGFIQLFFKKTHSEQYHVMVIFTTHTKVTHNKFMSAYHCSSPVLGRTMTLEESEVLPEMIAQFQDLGTSSSKCPSASRQSVRRTRSFESYMMDPDMDADMMDAAIPAVPEGGTTEAAESGDVDMVDTELTSTMVSSNTKRKRIRSDGNGATTTATSSCARHRGKRVCFHPIVSVGCAPSGVDRTRIRKRTPVTREEHWAFVCAQLKARMLQTTAAVMQ